jgi:hypothetical protein
MKYTVYFINGTSFTTRQSLFVLILKVFSAKYIAYIGIDTEGLEK